MRRSPPANENETSRLLISAARRLRRDLAQFQTGASVTHIYRPLDYAWNAHELYLRRYGGWARPILFLGMNPGPFGMMQTGIPFGQVTAVRDWLGIQAEILPPANQHPLRPVKGFACERSEVSGERLWGLFARQFGRPDSFFREHFVLNYCPLAFLESSGRNYTPDRLPASDRAILFAACDRHVRAVAQILRPEWIIGIGGFAAKRAERLFASGTIRVACILHPSPASPAANRNWAELVTAQLQRLGLWLDLAPPARKNRSMKTLLTCLFALSVLVVTARSGSAQTSSTSPLPGSSSSGLASPSATPAAPTSAGQPNDAEMMKQMIEMSKLNENHKLLADLNGNWSYTITMWMAPNAPPMKSTGTAVRRSIMGGRYAEMDVTGKIKMPGADGKLKDVEFKGRGNEGYDNVKKKFVGSWIDNMGTGIMLSEGDYDAASKTFTYTTEEEMMPGMKTKVREVVKVPDKNHMVMEWYEDRGGQDVKTMQIDYTRGK